MPEIDDFLGLGEKAMTANIEQEVTVPHGAADAANIMRVLLDHDDRRRFLGQAVSGRQARGAGADHENFCISGHARRDSWDLRIAFAQSFVNARLIFACKKALMNINAVPPRTISGR